MSSQQRFVSLSNAVQLPRIGLGTFRAKGADVQRAVLAAISLGITHIDTASIYKVCVHQGETPNAAHALDTQRRRCRTRRI
jgi:diketogulonate reductase-like aldo/keto reductase